MGLDRMLNMVMLLARGKPLPARELARHLEVSVRTVYRDVDTLTMAGIPVTAVPGNGGGIMLAPGAITGSLPLTSEERGTLGAALEGLESVTPGEGLRIMMDKMGLKAAGAGPALRIDLATHARDSLGPRITLLRRAIDRCRVVSFVYYSPTGRSERQVESAFVAFQWSDWYLVGWCRLRQDYRTFKLRRMGALEMLEELFVPRPIPGDEQDLTAFYAHGRQAVLLLDPALEYLAVETYGEGSYQKETDGLIVSWDYADLKAMTRQILGLGAGAKVLEPPELREAVRREAEKILAGASQAALSRVCRHRT